MSQANSAKGIAVDCRCMYQKGGRKAGRQDIGNANSKNQAVRESRAGAGAGAGADAGAVNPC
ncbi:hypothetical protein FOCG_08914 [Fusarium oxysporum f. sp. radicis-lycopersici 26381]|uniref:Uncharacterized protein n=1 Tax=Fusarium oxysporum Fo47 TaxID=660027 RepID=W9K8R8_FUSOX|nr:hypothetical protein FOZG_08320 [Fusarium oxysporum Fo47]EXL50689.1 hypothetical protein FOCG_08914 [Fusarium oxysporum f. sp. radicis-lycopersici 26381]